MKTTTKTRTSVVLAVVALAVAWAPGGDGLAAQEWTAPPASADVGHLEQHLFPPELIMRHYRDVGLTDQQRATVTGTMQDLQSALVDLQWRLFEVSERLSEAIGAPEIAEAEAVQLMRELVEIEGSIKTRHLTALIRIKNALTPEQQARLSELREHAGAWTVRPGGGWSDDTAGGHWSPDADTGAWLPHASSGSGGWLPGAPHSDAGWHPGGGIIR